MARRSTTPKAITAKALLERLDDIGPARASRSADVPLYRCADVPMCRCVNDRITTREREMETNSVVDFGGRGPDAAVLIGSILACF